MDLRTETQDNAAAGALPVMHADRTKMIDGRYLIYYTFDFDAGTDIKPRDEARKTLSAEENPE